MRMGLADRTDQMGSTHCVHLTPFLGLQMCQGNADVEIAERLVALDKKVRQVRVELGLGLGAADLTRQQRTPV